MANKYIRHGETYCGDGTSSAAATSNGGVGAWNNINVLEGTAPAYGALAAGDVVYIRSKDASGNDITRTGSSANITIGASAATNASWVTWVLDQGTVWSGIAGTLKYTFTSSYKLITRSYNAYVADVQDKWIVEEGNTAASYKEYTIATNCHVKNFLFDFSLVAAGNAGSTLEQIGYSVIENTHIKVKWHSNQLIRTSANAILKLINPDIELLDPTCTVKVFQCDSASKTEIIGGQCRGVGAVTGVLLANISDGASFTSVGFQFPKAMTYSVTDYADGLKYQSVSIGTDGKYGGVIRAPWGLADSRNDNNYPTLNATLPGSDEPWSWKICPQLTGRQKPANLPLSKYFTESAAIRVITLEMLVADTLSNVSKESVWITVNYTDDSTGILKTVDTRVMSGGSLDTSTAPWSATSYGSVSLLKRKVSVTTPTAIKQNTPITVTFCTLVKAASSTDLLNDILFIDPDFTVNAP